MDVSLGLDGLVGGRGGALVAEAELELGGERFEIRDTEVELVEFACTLLVGSLLGELAVELVRLGLVHGLEALREGLQKRVHRLGHLLVEVRHLAINVLHFDLGLLDLVPCSIEVLFVLLGPALALVEDLELLLDGLRCMPVDLLTLLQRRLLLLG